MFSLRDYQNNSVNAVRNSLVSGKKRPLLVLPTGGGKTVCFSYIAHSAGEKGNKVLILVHRQELVYQTKEKLDAFGIPHGVISPEFPHTDHPVQVAMIQTLTRRLDRSEKPDILIIDEAHHSNAANYKRVVEWAECPVIGVTATPCRMDGRGLGEIYDDICVGVTVSALIERGYLSPYKYFGVPVSAGLSSLRKKMGEYTTETQKELIAGVLPDMVKEWEGKAKGLPTIVFCPSVESSKTTAQMFQAEGYNFHPVFGDMDRLERKKLIAQLATGEIDGITSCDVVSEGTDIPVASCAILLRKTASTALFLQQCGRVLRPVEGKTAIIIDLVENFKEHGLPCDVRDWSLNGKVKKPIGGILCSECETVNSPNTKYCKECGELLKIKECPECMAIVLPDCKVCDCGHEFKRKKKEMMFSGKVTLQEVSVTDWRYKKAFTSTFGTFCSEVKGWKKGMAYYKMKMIETLGKSPDMATNEDWERAYKSESPEGVTITSYTSFNKKIYKEFLEWQISQKA